MNWLSALDLIPLAIVILCAIDVLRLITVRRHPMSALFIAALAIIAFERAVHVIHGAYIAWWVLLIDIASTAFLAYATFAHELKSSKRPVSRRTQPPIV